MISYRLVYHPKPLGPTGPTHRRTDANLYPPERQLANEPSFDLEGGAQGQI